MSFRPSQDPAYWTSDFHLTASDISFLQEYLLARERPVLEGDLADALIEFRFQREEQRIRRELARGNLYQPRESYEIGDTLVFPLLEFAVGEVVDKRTGRNPEHGQFDVVSVKLEESGEIRQFAASLETPHKLNLEDGAEGLGHEDLVGLEELIERYGRDMREHLHEALPNLREQGLVNLGSHWSLDSMLTEVHIGHLNIAEALIDVQNRPIATGDILPDLDLPQEVPLAMTAFSVDRALAGDDRFVDVGTEAREWYLSRMLPQEAVIIPRRLQHHADSVDRDKITVPLLQIEWELDDEWSQGGASSVSVAQLPSITLTLTYPHRRSGSLPLTDRTMSFFPVREGKRSMITLVDGRWGKRFSAWVVPEGRYVCGLGDWFDEHNIPVGAYIVLERTNEPGEVVVDFKPRRMKREWVRMARAEDGKLRFQLQKQAISAEYDETMIVAESDSSTIDELRRQLYEQESTLENIVEDIAIQLMGLSTEGTVHAKTIYSGLNIIRRTAPAPIFARMVANRRFADVGGGLFAMARN